MVNMEAETGTHITVGSTSNPNPLTSIPLEVLLQITSHLTTPEYGNLRLTCASLEATLYSSFTKEFFSKRQFMIARFSLQPLISISKSRLSDCLKHIIIGLERPITPVQPAFSPDPPSASNDRLYNESLDYYNLINSGLDVEMLCEAFSNLKNLKTIGMRDFDSTSRYRDYPQNSWKSYGVPTYDRETGCRIGLTRGSGLARDPDHIAKTFSKILLALSKAKARPESFEIILRHRYIKDEGFYLPENNEAIIQPVLASLRTLFLNLNSGDAAKEVDSLHLRKFLAKTSKLEHLRLNFQAGWFAGTNNVLNWLAQSSNPAHMTSALSAPGPVLPPTVTLDNLRQLDIGMITTDTETLLALLGKFRASLQVISLHRVSLLRPDVVTSSNRVDLWARFFSQLTKLDLKLSGINMSYLSQKCKTGKHYRDVRFKDTKNPGAKRWAGTDVQSGLRDFVNSVYLEGSVEDTESEDSPTSEYESEDDEVDEDIEEQEEITDENDSTAVAPPLAATISSTAVVPASD